MFDTLDPEDFDDTELGAAVRGSYAKGHWALLLGPNAPLPSDDPRKEMLDELATLRMEFSLFRESQKRLDLVRDQNFQTMSTAAIKMKDRLVELGEREVLLDVQATLEEHMESGG